MCTTCGAAGHLEAAHWDHSRGKNYDNPNNGMTLYMSCHLEDHISRSDNGLSKDCNDFAILALSIRLNLQEL